MSDDRFFDVRRAPADTTAGPVDMPILYKDASALGMVFPVDPERAASLVPAAFEPWTRFGRAFAVLCAFEYRESTIGPYDELGIGVLVRRKGASPSWLRFLRDMRAEENAALYVVNLPVTTAGAHAAGTELWGLPKYVTPMETHFEPERARVVLGSELEIEMTRSRWPSMKGLPLVLYSVNHGRVIRTVVDVSHPQTVGGKVTLKVTGDGPCSETVRALGMDRKKPLFAYSTDTMRSILPLGRDLGPAR
jgi:hypothetical protein